MRKTIAILAASLFSVHSPAVAATDSGLLLHDTGIGQRGSGVGISAQISIKLGGKRSVNRAERLKIGIAAGPVTVVPNVKMAGGFVRTAPLLVGFDFKPGFSTSLNFSGQKILLSNRSISATEESDQHDDDKQSNGDKIGWIAAVAGGVGLIVLGVLTIKASNGDFSE
jgi:hypothetical protein